MDMREQKFGIEIEMTGITSVLRRLWQPIFPL